MKIIPHGAAQEVTGSCHELQIAGKRILLDCGLFQGRRQESAEKNATFTFDPSKDIDAMILSHAHMDHVGRVPVLWKRGYRGPIHCTYATKDLSAVMLADGGYIQEKDEEFHCKHLQKSMMQCDGPLYTQKDAAACMELFKGKNYNEWFPVLPGIRAQFIEAGHVLGAAMVIIEAEENGVTRRIGFTGDLGRSTLPIIRDPAAMPPVEVLICESTYGDRLHGDITKSKEKLKEVIIRTAERGGKVLIPAFSLERTQQLVYDMHLLWDAKEIPALPIIIDSPLASKVTEVFQKHPECFDIEMFQDFLSRAHNPFQFSLVRYTDSPEESKSLNGSPGPMVIMAGSGMCEAGRIRHHLKNELADARNTVLAVGFMAKDTLGAKIVDPTIREVKIFDEFIAKKAEVVYIDAYSGHADKQDLDEFLAPMQDLKTLILVHGETVQMQPFAERTKATHATTDIRMPARHEAVEC
jgi:metallo-beta-lactamase family protein